MCVCVASNVILLVLEWWSLARFYLKSGYLDIGEPVGVCGGAVEEHIVYHTPPSAAPLRWRVPADYPTPCDSWRGPCGHAEETVYHLVTGWWRHTTGRRPCCSQYRCEWGHAW